MKTKSYSFKVFFDTGLGYTTSSPRFETERDALDFAKNVLDPKILKSQNVKYSIEGLDVGIGDRNYFTNFELDASGDNLQELIASATVSEIDQDGGEIDCIGLDDVPKDVFRVIMQALNNEVLNES